MVNTGPRNFVRRQAHGLQSVGFVREWQAFPSGWRVQDDKVTG